MERQAIGQAMAGMNPDDPQSVYAAAQRMASTGAAHSIQDADSLIQNQNTLALRKAMLQQQQMYRSDTLNRQWTPQIGGMLANVKTKEDYATVYNRLDQIAKRIDPNQDPSLAWGLPMPDNFTPGSLTGFGMTANNQQVSEDKGKQRAVSVANNAATNAARVQAAGIGAGGHIAAAGVSNNRPSPTTRLMYLQHKLSSGQQLTDGEQQEFAHYTQTSRSRRPLPVNPGGGNIPTLTPTQARSPNFHGTFRTTDGRVLHKP
jgi:hypothetical protein